MTTDTAIRTYWNADTLAIEDEPLAVSLLRYDFKKDRQRTKARDANLVSSITTEGEQMPILDMDFPHHIVPSATPGHNHLYIDVPMSKFRWFILMCALKYAGVIELGFFVWSVRRGGNFVRKQGVSKRLEDSTKSNYGWFRKLRN